MSDIKAREVVPSTRLPLPASRPGWPPCLPGRKAQRPDPAPRPDTRDLTTRLAWAVWAVLLTVLCVKVMAAPHRHSVYPIFARAAQNWLAGLDLYRPAVDLDLYRYSPLVTALLVPLRFVPAWLGAALWLFLNAGVYLAALAWWCRAVLPKSLTPA